MLDGNINMLQEEAGWARAYREIRARGIQSRLKGCNNDPSMVAAGVRQWRLKCDRAFVPGLSLGGLETHGSSLPTTIVQSCRPVCSMSVGAWLCQTQKRGACGAWSVLGVSWQMIRLHRVAYAGVACPPCRAILCVRTRTISLNVASAVGSSDEGTASAHA